MINKSKAEQAFRLSQESGGLSLRELGDRYGVSHETMRQAFKKYGLSTNGHSRYDLTVDDAWKRKGEIFAAYRRLGSITRVAKALDLPAPIVSEVVAKMPLRNAYRHRGKADDASKERIREALREAWSLAGRDRPLTTTAYRGLAAAHGLPALTTVKRPYGSFFAACRDARVKANSPRGRYQVAYTNDDCLDAIQACANYLEHTPSYDEYLKWHQDRRQYPSGPTIRTRWPWAEAVIEALE